MAGLPAVIPEGGVDKQSPAPHCMRLLFFVLLHLLRLRLKVPANKKKTRNISCGALLVGMAGFEPTTSSTPCWRDM